MHQVDANQHLEKLAGHVPVLQCRLTHIDFA